MKYYLKLFSVISFLTLLFVSCKQEVFTEPSTDSVSYYYGKAFINSNPAGASIYLNGKYTGYVTPDTIKWISEGNATVTLKKSLFWDTTFTINVDKSITEEFEIDYFGNPRMYGSIKCTSDPSGATIYLNNQNTGKITPATLDRLLPDSYDVKFDYPEYRKDSLTVTVRSTKETLASVTLEDTLDIVIYNPDNSEFPGYLTSEMAEDKNGNLWIGTQTKGLIKFDGKKFTRYKPETHSFIPSDYVSQVKKDKSNNLWFGFSNGLIRYDGTNWEKTNTKQINSIHIAYDNTMLAATDGEGIIRFKNGQYDKLTKSNSGLQSNYINSVCIDKEGKIWAALFENSLSVYDGSSWTHLDSAKNGLPTNQCCSLALSPDGDVIGMFYQYLSLEYSMHYLARFDGAKWVPIYSGNNKTMIRDIFPDKENVVWFNLGGIKRISDDYVKPIIDIVNSNLRFFNIHRALSFLYAEEVFIDSKGDLWLIGHGSGLVRIKKGRWSY